MLARRLERIRRIKPAKRATSSVRLLACISAPLSRSGIEGSSLSDPRYSRHSPVYCMEAEVPGVKSPSYCQADRSAADRCHRRVPMMSGREPETGPARSFEIR